MKALYPAQLIYDKKCVLKNSSWGRYRQECFPCKYKVIEQNPRTTTNQPLAIKQT